MKKKESRNKKGEKRKKKKGKEEKKKEKKVERKIQETFGKIGRRQGEWKNKLIKKKKKEW